MQVYIFSHYLEPAVSTLRTAMPYPEPRCMFLLLGVSNIRKRDQLIPDSVYFLPNNREQISGEGIQHIPESV
jgi:hypothetical protein